MSFKPGMQSDIADFCFRKGVAGANLFMKGDVNGPDTRPTYRFLKDKGVLGDVAWNFAGKFLIDRHGNGEQTSFLPMANIYDFSELL